MTGRRFTFAEAEHRLGPAAIAAARQNVESAPPARPELREQIRAVFASAPVPKSRSATTARPAADAA